MMKILSRLFPFKVMKESYSFSKPVVLNSDWNHFDEGKSIALKGSEGGKIIFDIERSNNARITLEKDCAKIPFVVTFGIYGLMFHTEYFDDETASVEYIQSRQSYIDEILEMYNTLEKDRDTFWKNKYEKLIEHVIEK